MMTEPISGFDGAGALLPNAGTEKNNIEPRSTQMFHEAGAAAQVVAAQYARNSGSIAALGAALRTFEPRAVVTCARGSSDHAATFAKYLVETRTGVLTASAAPSVTSLYGARQDLRECLFLVVSQSGRSPDLLATTEAARTAGALVVALVNTEDSPLMQIANYAIPLCAGVEHSVAATKSYIASLAAIVHLVAEWTADSALLENLVAAPELLTRAWGLDWDAAVPKLQNASHLYVIGRGVGLGIAQEAALKFKETCGLHAESFSSAEVQHGPQALLQGGFPALLLAQSDETHAGIETLAKNLIAREVDVLIAGADIAGAIVLPTIEAHPAVQPLLLAQSFYRLANELSIARGCDPDRPPNLRKVTETH